MAEVTVSRRCLVLACIASFLSGLCFELLLHRRDADVPFLASKVRGSGEDSVQRWGTFETARLRSTSEPDARANSGRKNGTETFETARSRSTSEPEPSMAQKRTRKMLPIGAFPGAPDEVDNTRHRVVYFILGGHNRSHTPWAKPNDTIIFLDPPKTCAPCPTERHVTPYSGKYGNASDQWWCAQRSYMEGLQRLVEMMPNADWYFLADADTVVFPHILLSVLGHLEQALEEHDDLYMGHASDLGYGRYVMSGGGVVLRGQTLRRLQAVLPECSDMQLDEWCYHHLDWVVASCLRKIGVLARGHLGFQQNVGSCIRCCENPPLVSCHPYKDLEERGRVAKKFIGYDKVTYRWSLPCNDSDFRFRTPIQSVCVTKFKW